MKAAASINYNEIFSDVSFAEELNSIVFGAELALRYANIPEITRKEIKRNIIRSAFAPFSLNYDAMSGAAQSVSLKPSARPAPAYTNMAAEPPDFFGLPGIGEDFNFAFGKPGQNGVNDGNAMTWDPDGPFAPDYQLPAADGGGIQSDVYGNDLYMAEGADSAREPSDGFGVSPHSISIGE